MEIQHPKNTKNKELDTYVVSVSRGKVMDIRYYAGCSFILPCLETSICLHMFKWKFQTQKWKKQKTEDQKHFLDIFAGGFLLFYLQSKTFKLYLRGLVALKVLLDGFLSQNPYNKYVNGNSSITKTAIPIKLNFLFKN